MLPIKGADDGKTSTNPFSSGQENLPGTSLVPVSSDLSGSQIVSIVEQYEMRNQLAAEVVERQLVRQAQKLADVADSTEELADWRETGYKRDLRVIADNLESLGTRHENLVKQLNLFASEVASKHPVRAMQSSIAELQGIASKQSVEIANTRAQQECIMKRQDHVLRTSANVAEVRFIKSEVESLSSELQKYTELVKNLSTMVKARENSGESERISRLYVDLNIVRREVERIALLIESRSVQSELSGKPESQSHVHLIEALGSRLSEIETKIVKNDLEVIAIRELVMQAHKQCDTITHELQKTIAALRNSHDTMTAKIENVQSEMNKMKHDVSSATPRSIFNVEEPNQDRNRTWTLSNARRWMINTMRSTKGRIYIAGTVLLIIGRLREHDW